MMDGAAHPSDLNAIRHDSADRQVAGTARYADDGREPPDMVHMALGLSTIAHGYVSGGDLEAVRGAPGVLAVFTADDVPGINDTGPVIHDEPAFALSEETGADVSYHGQCLFAVAAETREQARAAVRLARLEYSEVSPILTIDEAIEARSYLSEPYRMARGDAARAGRPCCTGRWRPAMPSRRPDDGASSPRCPASRESRRSW